MTHTHFMQWAFAEAQAAYALGEVPIGCVVVHAGEVIGRAHNRRTLDGNVLHHAEILAIDQACRALGDWRLENCTAYVTLEPCAMCAGAMLQARLPVLVYGAASPKAGCAGSLCNLLDMPGANHRAQIIPGVMEAACAALLQEFFTRFRT